MFLRGQKSKNLPKMDDVCRGQSEILDLQSEKYGLSFDVKKYTTSG